MVKTFPGRADGRPQGGAVRPHGGAGYVRQLIPVLHALFERSLDRWAQQQHEPRALARWRGLHRDSIRKFELMARNLGDACRIWVAWRGGQPAAAISSCRGPTPATSGE